MRRILWMQTILLSVSVAAAAAQPAREFQGRVFHLGKDEEKLPDKGIVVTCQETGSSDDTNDQGIFRLPLPSTLQPGSKVTLSIDKPGWRIRYPLEGEVVIRASLEKEIVPIEILPVGSKLFWTNSRIEKFIEDSIESAKRETSHERKQPADLGRYLKDWASNYGFSPQDVQKEIDRWISEVETNQTDVHKLGLAAFAKKQFRDAARRFRDSAEWNAHQLEQAQQRQQELTKQIGTWREGLVRDLRLEGDSYFQEEDYQKALDSYQEAHSHTSRDETPELWAATLNDIGHTLTFQTLRGTSSESGDMAQAEQAVQAHRQALLIFTYEKFPQEWAGTLNSLGYALDAQSNWAGEPRSAQLLAEAVQAYRQALQIYTRERFPQDWAGLQLNLGSALTGQGRRAVGEPGAQLLKESIEANRRALLVFTREKFPQDWVAAQINLSSALSEYGLRIGGERGAQLLTEAIEACRQSLLAVSREQAPQRWAMLQNNLGSALTELGTRTEGEHGIQLLTESVETCRHALLACPREQFPIDWAATQSNLGTSLFRLGWRTEGEQSLQAIGESVRAFRQALLVYRREQFPTEWVRVQTALQGALLEQGRRTEGEPSLQFLGESVEALRQILLVYTREQFPQPWALTQNNLGATLYEQGKRTEGERGTQLLAESAEAYRQALLVHTREQFPQDWAMFQNNLAYSLLEQGWRTTDEQGVRLLAEAAEANRQALSVYTREQFPTVWAKAQNQIGFTLSEQGKRTEGERRARILAEAVQAFRSAREILTYGQFPADWTSSRKEEVQALRLSSRYEEAAQGLSEILGKNPDDEWAVNSLADLLNNELFEYQRSLSVSQQWLARNPGDQEARYREIEALFATGAFADCQARSQSLRSAANLKPNQQAALLGYQVAAEIAVGLPGSAPDLIRLIDVVEAQPPGFRVGFSFPGTLHVLRDHSDFPRRDLLVLLFQALESQDRGSLLQGLRDLQKHVVERPGTESGRAPLAGAGRGGVESRFKPTQARRETA